MLFNHDYPYTNFHELNLEWLLRQFKELKHTVEDFKIANEIRYMGAFDITKNYPKGSIVLSGDLGYISINPVPAGISLDDLRYWVPIGALTPEALGMIERVQELGTDITNLSSDVEQLNENVSEIINILADIGTHDVATYHVTIYVDAQNGDDTNDGLSRETSVKTLKRAFDVMNATSSGAYIRFISAGDYVLSYPVISGAMVHFMFDASNVNLYWLDANDDGWTKCFYSCYINMHGNNDKTSKLYLRGSNPAYLEGGKLTISNMTIESDENGAFGIVGGAIQSSSNVYKTHLYISTSQGSFSNDSFESASNYHSSAIHVYNSSDISFRGGVKFKDLDSNATITNMISGTASTIRVLQDIILENTTHLTKRIYGASCQFLGGENRLISWLTDCNLDRCMINGDYFSQTYHYPLVQS